MGSVFYMMPLANVSECASHVSRDPMKPSHMTNQEKLLKISRHMMSEPFECVDYEDEHPMIFTNSNNWEVK